MYLFGYVKPYKPELKIAEFEWYKGIYCGLCKQMGRLYGPIARMMLSYDMTFLALVSLSLKDQCHGLKRQVCIAHPLTKKNCMCACDDLSFAAHTAMIMAYYKVKDNIRDSGFWGKIKYALALPVVSFTHRKAKKCQPEMEEAVAAMMEQQWKAEQETVTSIDRASDPTATALGKIAAMLGTDEKRKYILQKVGYMLGKYIYLIDALDDLEDDIKTGNYNPYLLKFHTKQPTEEQKKEIIQYAVEVTNLTIAQLAAAYELLDIKRFKPILDNIIYLGLKDTRTIILQKREKQNDRSISDSWN